jgi:hypothetical protein
VRKLLDRQPRFLPQPAQERAERADHPSSSVSSIERGYQVWSPARTSNSLIATRRSRVTM